MADVAYVLGAQSGEYLADYMLDANCVAGAVALMNTSDASAGEVVNATTTGAADVIGLYTENKTYTAAPAVGSADELLGVAARIAMHPFCVYRFRAAGSATSGTRIGAAVLTDIIAVNTVADATRLIVTDAGILAVDFAGGTMKGRRGSANAGQIRRIITHNANTDERVEVAFTRTIAVGDSFIRVPWSKAIQTVQLTTDLTEADATIAVNTGAPYVVLDLKIDEVNDEVYVLVMPLDHALNPA